MYIGLAVGIVTALLLIVIITVMVISDSFKSTGERKIGEFLPSLIPHMAISEVSHLESILVTKSTVAKIIGIVFARCSKW